MTQLIFLDQNHWITLARAYNGKEDNPDLVKLANKVISKSESEEAIFPLIINHFIETTRRVDPESRLKLAKFMVKVSNGHTMLPYCIVTPHEVEEAICKEMGWPQIDLHKFVLRKGFDYLIGGEASIEGKGEMNGDTEILITEEIIEKTSDWLPDSFRKQLFDYIGKKISLNVLIRHYFDSPDNFLLFCERFYESDKERFNDKELVKTIEALRKEKRDECPDKDYRYRVELARAIYGRLVPLMTEVYKKYQVPIEILKARPIPKDLDEFIKNVPTFYVDFQLTYLRDIDYNTPVDVNDLMDITALAVAIPYCDIVVFERKFGSFVRQKKLDKLYGTVIITNLLELNDYL